MTLRFNQFNPPNSTDDLPELDGDVSEYGDVPAFLKSDTYMALSFYSKEGSRKIIIRFDDWLLYKQYKMREQEK